ncbi:MAG: twin-arginine translocase subunit TatC [Candidatus Bathyarchaeota archaeon]|nr:twin-arginine translocase subunit TatC [Candidatus Bathyarchaeota archaeon]
MSEDLELTVWDHFEDLSSKLRRIVVVLLVTMMIVMSVPADLTKIIQLDFEDYTPLVSAVIEILQDTLLPEDVVLIAFNWLDSFYIFVVISFTISLLICLPYVAAQIYSFLAPAIYETEKRGLFIFVSVFLLLFISGVLYAYYIIVPTTFAVLYRFVNQTRVMPFYSVKDFFDLITFGLIGTGLFYTFPLVIYLVVKVDLLQVDSLREIRKELFVGLAVLTAFLTPDPTPVSMLLMTIPFYVFYELTIIVLTYTMRGKPDRVIVQGLQASLDFIEKAEFSETKSDEADVSVDKSSEVEP